MKKQYQLKSLKRDGSPTITTKVGQSLKSTNDRIAETVVNTHKKLKEMLLVHTSELKAHLLIDF